LRGGECPGCRLDLTLGSVLGFYWRTWKGKIGFGEGGIEIRCPCGRVVPFKTPKCECGRELTVEATVQGSVDSVRARAQHFIGSISDEAIRRFQWGYLLVSLATTWWMMGYVENRLGDQWYKSAALSVVYLVGGGLVFSILVPRQIVRGVWLYATWLVKLSALANYLSLLLLFQVLSDVWWMRATNMAGLLFASFAAAFGFYWLVVPIRDSIQAGFADPPKEKHLDPRGDQGRRGRFD
jgi:hypothetical protein